MKIGGLQEITLIDYPGKLACTVFCLGCSFKCPFCYSGELVLAEKMKDQPEISEEIFFAFLKTRKKLLEGVVICGGEPTVHGDLPDFLTRIKDAGFLVKLDTNGSNSLVLESLINKNLVDYVAMDIKAPKDKYPSVVGLGELWTKRVEDSVQKSINILMAGPVDYEFRSTIVPGLHTREDILEMAKWIRGAKRYYLQNFRPEKTIDPSFEKVRPYSDEFMLEVQHAISPFFEICRLR